MRVIASERLEDGNGYIYFRAKSCPLKRRCNFYNATLQQIEWCPHYNIERAPGEFGELQEVCEMDDIREASR